ncbi:hypothetical protein OUZ56_003263 [Daphnia magna]|uniref:Uncharacterized protein n=1 Tax=Daphnia magna TaxID=35525 RepID=A0ABR0A892_9CRUS|nr:hypothetical protein OUZ56_003263 [Daphnia magna]
MESLGREELLDKKKKRKINYVMKLQEEVVQLKSEIVSIKVAFTDTAINNFNAHVAISNTSYPAKLDLSTNRFYAQTARGPPLSEVFGLALYEGLFVSRGCEKVL